MQVGDLLVVEWPRPGEVRFGVNGWREPGQKKLVPAAGVMGGHARAFRAALLRITADVRRVEFTFRGADGMWLGRDFFIRID